MTRFNLLSVFVLIWLLPAGAIALTLWLTPNVVTRTGNVGAFVSAIVHPGNLFASDVTDVQTSAGSFAVSGTFSAQRGQALLVRDSTKGGLELCAMGDSTTCFALAGQYVGALNPSPASGAVLTFRVREILWLAAESWIVLGLLGFVLIIMAAVERSPGGEGAFGEMTR